MIVTRTQAAAIVKHIRPVVRVVSAPARETARETKWELLAALKRERDPALTEDELRMVEGGMHGAYARRRK